MVDILCPSYSIVAVRVVVVDAPTIPVTDAVPLKVQGRGCHIIQRRDKLAPPVGMALQPNNRPNRKSQQGVVPAKQPQSLPMVMVFPWPRP